MSGREFFVLGFGCFYDSNKMEQCGHLFGDMLGGKIYWGIF